jgi:hypothetical protein
MGIAFEMALASFRLSPTTPIQFVRLSLEKSSSLRKPAGAIQSVVYRGLEGLAPRPFEAMA